MMRERFALARQQLSTCNYFLAGLALAVAAGWDEIKPLLVEVLGGFLPEDRIKPVMALLGIFVILIRGGWALRPPAGGPGAGPNGGPR